MAADRGFDSTDRELLKLLQQDARRSITELGKTVHLSRTAVQARLARLERDGIIVGYTAILGKPVSDNIAAMIALRFDHAPCKSVIDQIKDWQEIVQGYSVAGPLDAMLVVQVGSTDQLSDLAERLRAVPEIDEVEVTLILKSFTGSHVINS